MCRRAFKHALANRDLNASAVSWLNAEAATLCAGHNMARHASITGSGANLKLHLVLALPASRRCIAQVRKEVHGDAKALAAGVREVCAAQLHTVLAVPRIASSARAALTPGTAPAHFPMPAR
jgi:hypothetical protein